MPRIIWTIRRSISGKDRYSRCRCLFFVFTPNPPLKTVISTEAADSLIVCRAVERPPHFVFAATDLLLAGPDPTAPSTGTGAGRPILRVFCDEWECKLSPNQLLLLLLNPVKPPANTSPSPAATSRWRIHPSQPAKLEMSLDLTTSIIDPGAILLAKRTHRGTLSPRLKYLDLRLCTLLVRGEGYTQDGYENKPGSSKH
jgi:hypothetical protein